jgi:uncharacterized membrane protein
MNPRLKPELRRDLAQRELRQKQDGYLVWFMVIISLFPVVNFVLSPSASTTFVMALFLIGLGAACVRLLNAAAKAVALRQLIGSSHEIVEAESLNHSGIQPDRIPGREHLN